MKKLLLLILLSFIFSACASTMRDRAYSAFPPMLDGMYDNNPILVDQRIMQIKEIIDSICFLRTETEFKVEDADDPVTLELDASGILIFDKYILTVTHAVSQDNFQMDVLTLMGMQKLEVPAEKLKEHTYLKLNGGLIKLEEMVKGKEDDIAIFKVPDDLNLSSFPYKIGNSDDLQVGNFIYVIGNPMNYGINVREGIVSSAMAPEALATVLPHLEDAFMVSSGINPGDSGTPVVAIRDGQYELVGLSQGILTRGQNLGWAVKINPVIRKLKEGIEGIKNSKGNLGKNTERASLDPPQF